MATILIIDEEPDFVEFLSRTLEAHDHQVLDALNVAEGIRIAEERQPGLILLDLMSGLKAFVALRELFEGEKTGDIPIIIMTTSPPFPTEGKVRPKAWRIDDYLVKRTLSTETLVESVNRVLGSRDD